jgi:hypothetical protein
MLRLLGNGKFYTQQYFETAWWVEFHRGISWKSMSADNNREINYIYLFLHTVPSA